VAPTAWRQLAGSVKFSQAGSGAPITVNGRISGLNPNTPYVTVAYIDNVCLPTPGVTAFPSGGFWANSSGVAAVNTTVNPQGVNPVGQFDVIQTESVSVRQVLVSGITVPGTPIVTPNIPNAAPPEACDQAPVTR